MQHEDDDPRRADEPQRPEDHATSDEGPTAMADDGLAPLIDNTGADDAPGGDADASTG